MWELTTNQLFFFSQVCAEVDTFILKLVHFWCLFSMKNFKQYLKYLQLTFFISSGKLVAAFLSFFLLWSELMTGSTDPVNPEWQVVTLVAVNLLQEINIS